jgi:O-antigen ligase
VAQPTIITVEAPYRLGPGRQVPVRTIAILDRALLYFLALLLMFGPLAFGAVEYWSSTVLEIGAAAVLVLWGVRQALAGEIAVQRNPLMVPIALFGAVVGVQLVLARSAYPYVTMAQARLWLAYALLFLVATHVFANKMALRWMLHALTIFGVALAVFAIVQSFTSNGMIYWVRKPRFGHEMYGPYVNHNHFAGLMELLAPIPLMLALHERLRWEQRLMYALVGTTMAATIVSSASRGGMVSFAVEVLFVAAVLLLAQRSEPTLWRGMAILIVAAALVAALNLDTIAARFGNLDDPARRAIFADSLRIFRLKPLLGWGLGTFPTIYPKFSSYYTDLFINAAHNDYLQILVETGLAGFAALLWFVIALLRRGVSRIQGHPFRTAQVAALAGMTGCVGLLTHSFLDFNLQIPANALLFVVMAAIATTEIAPGGRSLASDQDGHETLLAADDPAADLG